MLWIRPFLSVLLVALGIATCFGHQESSYNAQARTPERSHRPVWRAVPLVKNNLKAAEAMSNIRKEFSGAKSKTEERAILKKYLRETYVDPLQTTKALYAAFYYGSKHRVRLALDEERFLGLSSKRVSDAFEAHLRLAEPSVIEYAKVAVLFFSSEHSFNLPSQTIRDIYQLFKKDPHFPWLLIAFEASLSLRDKQNRIVLYNETKSLYDSFPEKSVYIHSSDSRNSRIKLNAHLMLMSFTLYKSCNLDWGLEAAKAHYNELMRFNNPDQEVRMTQKRVRALREQFNF